jgi:hypothetical protein
VLVELAFGAIDEGVRLLAGQRPKHVAHDLRVGVHAGERLAIFLSPAAEQKPVGLEQHGVMVAPFSR